MMDRVGCLAGKTILVVENEWLIADDLRRSLENEGAHVAGPVGSVGQALVLVRHTFRIDAAMLDIHLDGGGNIYPVAEVLRSLNVPFMFATGYDAQSVRHDFVDVPHLMKPFPLSSVSQILARATSAELD